MQEAVLYETDSGLILVQEGEVVFARPMDKDRERAEGVRIMGEEIKRRGITKVKVSSMHAKEQIEEMGLETSIISDEEREELDSRREALLQ